jgi:hypothetical protein
MQVNCVCLFQLLSITLVSICSLLSFVNKYTTSSDYIHFVVAHSCRTLLMCSLTVCCESNIRCECTNGVLFKLSVCLWHNKVGSTLNQNKHVLIFAN